METKGNFTIKQGKNQSRLPDYKRVQVLVIIIFTCQKSNSACFKTHDYKKKNLATVIKCYSPESQIDK